MFQKYPTRQLQFLSDPIVCPGITSGTKGLFAVSAIAIRAGGEPSGFYLHPDGSWYDKVADKKDSKGYFRSAELAQKAISVSTDRDRSHKCFVAAGRDIWKVCRDVAEWQKTVH